MRKIFSFSIILAISIFSMSFGEVYASLVTVDKAGDVVINVLSEEDSTDINNQTGTIEVVGGASEVKYSNAKIALTKEKGKLALETPSGYKFLSILPKQAASVLLRAKLATTITQDERAYILEDEKGNLYYDLTAKKIIPIFNIYNYEFGVRANVSATTGEIISIDEPTWYRFFNFLFV